MAPVVRAERTVVQRIVDASRRKIENIRAYAMLDKSMMCVTMVDAAWLGL